MITIKNHPKTCVLMLLWLIGSGQFLACDQQVSDPDLDNSTPVAQQNEAPKTPTDPSLDDPDSFARLLANESKDYGRKAFEDGLRTVQEADDFKIGVIARRWVWTAVYPGEDGQLWTEDDIKEESRITIPAGQAVVFEIKSDDVIHCLYIPEARIKKDALPGRTNTSALKPMPIGTYDFFCAEYCGQDHSQMTGELHVVEQTAFDEHLASIGQSDVTKE